MKCEICGHKIPINQNECPNYGNRLKKKHQVSYHVDSLSHEHVKVNQVKKNNVNIFGFKKGVYIIILCIFIVLFIRMIISDDTSCYSFENYIEEVGDENNNIALAIRYRNEIEKYLEDKNLDNIYYDDCVYDSDTLKAECIFNCSDDVGEYILSFTFINGKQSQLKLEAIMENVTHNTYTSLSNLNVFNELLDKDIAKEIKKVRERENNSGYQEVDYEDGEIKVYEYGFIDSEDDSSDYSLEYTIAAKGYKINE